MLTLSPEAFTLHGGCDCTSIRYKISLPPLSSRKIHSTQGDHGENHIDYPQIFLDHCNRCRRVSGAIIQAWLTCPQEWVEWELTSSSTLEKKTVQSTKEVIEMEQSAGTVVANYESSPGITRSFCGKCGTNLSYVFVDREGKNEVPTVDIVLGSLDTESLETEGVRPNRHFYWESGVEWVKSLITDGDSSLNDGRKLPKHPDGSRLDFV